jgi:transposase
VQKRRLHHPGRKRIHDRRTLSGILFVLRTGIAWQQLPQELGYSSGMTCWRRLQEWQQAGVFQALHERLLSQLRAAGRLDLSRAVCDSTSLRALFGGDQTGPSPVDRRKLGSKHHLITDANGIPLACLLTGANAHDVTQLLPLVEAIPAIRGVVGRPPRRPAVLLADRGYDSQAHRQALRTLGIRPLIARRKTAHGSGLGSQRWVVERTLSWLHQHRRLRIRYERQAEIHQAFLSLACSLICLRALRGSFC